MPGIHTHDGGYGFRARDCVAPRNDEHSRRWIAGSSPAMTSDVTARRLDPGYARSKPLGQPRLTQNGMGGVAAGNADGHREIPLRDGAVPDFVAAAAPPDQRAAGARSKSRNARSNCGATQPAAGSASRNAVICRNSDSGSTSG